MANISDDSNLYEDYYMFTTLPDFKASQVIWKVVPPVLIVLGSIGNILSIVVLTRKSIRNSITPLLTFLAFSDILVLYIGLLRQWIYYTFDYDIRQFSAIACKIHLWLVYTCLDLSAWIIMALTLDRVIATWWPFRARRLCTRTCAMKVVATIVFFLLIVNSHFLYGMANKAHRDSNGTVVDEEKCVPVYEYYFEFLVNVWGIFDLLKLCLIPFSVILVGNICIVVKLMKNKRRLTTINETNIRRRSSSAAASSLTVMMLILSTVFLITTLPISVYITGDNYWGQTEEPQSLASLKLWWAIVNMLMYANNCVNFLLYCLSGSRFRKEAKQLFCVCHRKGPKAPGVLASVIRPDVVTDLADQPTHHTHSRNDTSILESTESIYM